jgi:hypothetical protein
MSSRFFPFALVTADPATGLRAPATSATPIDQQLANAFNANNDVLAYTTGIANTNLPTLAVEPGWYKTFKTQFAQTKIHAMKWTNSIAPQLVGIPTGIADYAFTWTNTMTSVDAALSVLVTDPTNQGAQRAVVNGLNKLLDGLTGFDKIVAQFGQEIKGFDGHITADALILKNASAQSRQEAGYNKEQVKKLTDDIARLKAEIKIWQAVMPVAGIAGGVLFWIGAVIAIFSLGIGLAFGIVGAAAGIALMVAADVKIKQLSAEIKKDQANMNDLNQQIASLEILVTSLDDLANLAQLASVQMKLLMEAWTTLGTELKTVITDLENANGDVSNLDIAGLQRDLNIANADWKTLRELCLTVAGIKYLQASPATATLPTETAAAAA